MGKRILLTGATGFLGSHLLRRFIADGHEVTILKRSFSDTQRIEDCLDVVRAVDLDHQDMKDMLLPGSIDCVVHTATAYGRSGESFLDISRSNLLFPMELLERTIDLKVPLFINTDTVLPPTMNAYALSKAQFVQWLEMFAEQGKVHFVNIRLEHMYGPGDDTTRFVSFIMSKLRASVERLELTPGEQLRDFIYIDDVVDAYCAILEYETAKQGTRVYDVGSGQAVSIQHLVTMLRDILGSSTELAFGAKAYREKESMFSQADISKLCQLGWSPRYGLEQGLRELIKHKEHE